MNKSNTLYWKTATDPAERIEVRLVLNSYIDNDNLYVGLESQSKDNPECWESYTDITVNLNSLPRSMPMWTTGTATDMCMIF